MSRVRRATRSAAHAGSWYSDEPAKLGRQLAGWLGATERVVAGPVRAVIAPHAGYSYSGPTAAHAYVHLDPDGVRRVFVLGPSHHVHLSGCAVSGAAVCHTPVGELNVDRAVREELVATGEFEVMDLDVDEAEHSIEMHLPYIAQVMKGKEFTIVPIMVGALSSSAQRKYGGLLARYMQEPGNFFVISSDFCHWGARFQYTFRDESKGEIWESIAWLDREGMNIIETQDPDRFSAYLKQFGNTICGRYPISVLLHMMRASSLPMEVSFVKYAQSSKCRSLHDSSVSYASAVVRQVSK